MCTTEPTPNISQVYVIFVGISLFLHEYCHYNCMALVLGVSLLVGGSVGGTSNGTKSHSLVVSFSFKSLSVKLLGK